MAVKNQVKMSFLSFSENVALARIAAATFASQIDLTLNEIEEIKVAVSEAVSNSVIHAYKDTQGIIEFTMTLYEESLEFIVKDYGVGIENVAQAKQPAFSTDPERMGLGFVFMESFMDNLSINSVLGKGTSVVMTKNIMLSKSH